MLKKLASLGLPIFWSGGQQNFSASEGSGSSWVSTRPDWSQVKAGVPQGTLVGPISFLLHISDLQIVVNHVKYYVDDSSLWEVCGADGGDSVIQVAIDQALEWSASNLMTINAEKTKETMTSFFNKPVAPPPATINNTAIEPTETFKLLGVVLSNELDWYDHCEYNTIQY